MFSNYNNNCIRFRESAGIDVYIWRGFFFFSVVELFILSLWFLNVRNLFFTVDRVRRYLSFDGNDNLSIRERIDVLINKHVITNTRWIHVNNNCTNVYIKLCIVASWRNIAFTSERDDDNSKALLRIWFISYYFIIQFLKSWAWGRSQKSIGYTCPPLFLPTRFFSRNFR